VTGGDSDVTGAAAVIAMWVDPRYRGRGVGDALVGHVASWASGRGCDRLFLWVTDVNVAAQRLYERHGFVPTGARQEVREGEPAMEFEMVKDLRSGA
jgi:GNAT superfamily N-acetyltransferase